MPTEKDQAVVIRLLDWSETSQIAVLLTHQHGRISTTAKGARRLTPSTMAKFSGGLELLTRGEAVFITKATTDLANLTEWHLEAPYWHLRQSLRSFQLGMYAGDLVYHLITDNDPHPEAFLAMDRLLSDLATPAHDDAALLRFQWDLIASLGYQPILDCDAQTGEALPDHRTYAFSAAAGGLVRDSGSNDRWRVRRATIETLRLAADQEDLLPLASTDLDRANRLLCTYLRSLLDKELPTMRYILK